MVLLCNQLVGAAVLMQVAYVVAIYAAAQI